MREKHCLKSKGICKVIFYTAPELAAETIQ